MRPLEGLAQTWKARGQRLQCCCLSGHTILISPIFCASASFSALTADLYTGAKYGCSGGSDAFSTGENPMDPAWVPTSLPISYGGWGHVVWVWQLVQGSEKGVYGLGSLQKHSPSLPWSTDGVPQTVKISEKRFIVISFQIFQICSICLLYH